ncbi:hypothetical protein [Streptomyces sp. Ncost-T10-10d]|uniref:hypothetical protein n=1 Tax=Streptomyces sp. Ncost-T10-10d TaxID=1839774 RepID=UPI00114CB7DB|nr:hypothetical protein [Streptomyces sp. Ncost-T10-10d]
MNINEDTDWANRHISVGPAATRAGAHRCHRRGDHQPPRVRRRHSGLGNAGVSVKALRDGHGVDLRAGTRVGEITKVAGQPKKVCPQGVQLADGAVTLADDVLVTIGHV